MLVGKAGSFPLFDAHGNMVRTFHYGKGLQKPCEDCKQPAGSRCTTVSGKLLNKCHKVRLTD